MECSAATTITWNWTSDISQDPWRHNNKQYVRCRTRTHNNQFVRTCRHSMLSEFYVAMEWTTPRCRLFSALSSSPSCSMHQVRGGDSLRQQSDIVLMHLFVVVHVVVSFHLTRRRLKLCRPADEELFKKKTTVSAHAGTTFNFRIVSVILLTVTFLRECCSLASISV